MNSDVALKAIQDLLPDLPYPWFANIDKIVSTVLDVSQCDLIGHSEAQQCQGQCVNEKACTRDSDFILLNVICPLVYQQLLSSAS